MNIAKEVICQMVCKQFCKSTLHTYTIHISARHSLACVYMEHIYPNIALYLMTHLQRGGIGGQRFPVYICGWGT